MLTCKSPFWEIYEVSKGKKIIAFKKISSRTESFIDGPAEWTSNIWKHSSNFFPDIHDMVQGWDLGE